MKVVVSANAAADIERIGDWIASDNPQRAISFTNELFDAIDGLAEMPSRFPLVDGHEAHGVRRRLVGNYLILYHIGDVAVGVLHVVHAARDYAAVLDAELGLTAPEE